MTYPDIPRPLRRQPYMGGPCELLPPPPPPREVLIHFQGGPQASSVALVTILGDEPIPNFIGYAQSADDPTLFIWRDA